MTVMKRIGLTCAVAASAIGLGGCVDDYGYGGVGVGYGPAEYSPGYDGYYDGFYGAYGDPAYGYGYPGYYGWYGGFYYPGSGGFVYDRYRRPYRWNGAQRRYWSGQQRAFGGDHGGRNFRPGANWGGFNHGAAAGGGFNRPAGQAFRGGGAHMGGRTGGGGGRHR
jgi:hypothetical protein